MTTERNLDYLETEGPHKGERKLIELDVRLVYIGEESPAHLLIDMANVACDTYWSNHDPERRYNDERVVFAVTQLGKLLLDVHYGIAHKGAFELVNVTNADVGNFEIQLLHTWTDINLTGRQRYKQLVCLMQRR